MKREQELEKRRAHVEQLLRWQQRLDREERDVIEMERRIMKNAEITHARSKYNTPDAISLDTTTNTKVSDRNKSNDSARSYRKIKEIESSLTVLQNLPNTTSSIENDYVSTTGVKLNKLWRRLTGESSTTDKFCATQHYHLSKNDLEQIYEDAKAVVLQHFNSSTDILNGLEQTVIVDSNTTAKSIIVNDIQDNSKNESVETTIVQNTANHQYFDEDSLNSIANIETDVFIEPIVPLLNLNFSPEPTSDIGTVISDNGAGYYLSEANDKKSNENSASVPEQVITTTSLANDESSETVIYSEIESTSTPILAQTEIVSKLQLYPPSLIENEESIIMIEDVSFPNISEIINNDDDINNIADDNNDNDCEQIQTAMTFTIESDNQQYTTKIKDITTTALECNDKYLSDDFESDDKTTPTTTTIGKTTTATPTKCLSEIESKCSDNCENTNHHTETIAEEDFECLNNSYSSCSKSSAQERDSSVENTISDNSSDSNSSEIKSRELEQRLIDIDESLKDINDKIDKAPVMELSSKSPSPERSIKKHTVDGCLLSPPLSSVSISSDDSNKENDNGNQQAITSVIASTGSVLPLTSLKTVRNLNGFEVYPQAAVVPSSLPPPPPPLPPPAKSIDEKSSVRDYVSPSTEYKIPNKMPDIISEAEVLRRQQLQIEQEVNILFLFSCV